MVRSEGLVKLFVLSHVSNSSGQNLQGTFFSGNNFIDFRGKKHADTFISFQTVISNGLIQLHNMKVSDEGYYACKVTNKVGTYQKIFKMAVKGEYRFFIYAIIDTIRQ